jgi:hypothetical protein
MDVQGGAGLTDVDGDPRRLGRPHHPGDLTPQQLVVTFTNRQDETISRTINVAWDSYVVFLEGNDQQAVASRAPSRPRAPACT